MSAQVGLTRLQENAAEWTDRNFPDDDLLQRLGVLTEEVGEVARCIVKMHQGIRGTRDEWMAELYKEVGDVQFSLLSLCHRAGISLANAATDRWNNLARRDFRANPQQQGIPTSEEGSPDAPLTEQENQ